MLCWLVHRMMCCCAGPGVFMLPDLHRMLQDTVQDMHAVLARASADVALCWRCCA
jgi:hypothetical protein